MVLGYGAPRFPRVGMSRSASQPGRKAAAAWPGTHAGYVKTISLLCKLPVSRSAPTP